MPDLCIDGISGIRLIAHGRGSPLLTLVLPGVPAALGRIEIEAPEHVWARRAGAQDVVRLHEGTLGGDVPAHDGACPWHTDGAMLRMELPLAYGMSLRALARLEPDGLRLRYEFHNPTAVAYAAVQAVSCVKLLGVLSDPRLERGWVHHADGFARIATELPDRLTIPLSQWFPCRYLIPYEWPVSPLPRERDGEITRYHAPRRVDGPFLATRTGDGAWTIATMTRQTGNVWTNPERSCQHADPATPLHAHGHAQVELKIFVLQGDLEHLLGLVRQERQQG